MEKTYIRQDSTMTTPTKKMIPVLILKILREHTDSEHTLSQTDIIGLLESEYGLTVERKAVRHNLDYLIDMEFPIQYKEIVRQGKSESNTIISDLWIERDFTDGELRLLIDSLLFSHHIPHKQLMELAHKIENLSSKYFKSYVKHIETLPDAGLNNPQLFLNIEQLDEAIEKKRKIKFQYLDTSTDKKMYPKENFDGNIREYIASPYQMAAKDGKYYLICNYDPYDDVSNYRIDRMKSIAILKDRIKPFKTLKDSGKTDLNLGQYMSEHIYMYSSGNVNARFSIVRPMVADVIDIFGKNVRFEDDGSDVVIVRANVTEAAMLQFAKSYAPDVVILEPQSLVDQMKEWAKKVKKVYGG